MEFEYFYSHVEIACSTCLPSRIVAWIENNGTCHDGILFKHVQKDTNEIGPVPTIYF